MHWWEIRNCEEKPESYKAFILYEIFVELEANNKKIYQSL